MPILLTCLMKFDGFWTSRIAYEVNHFLMRLSNSSIIPASKSSAWATHKLKGFLGMANTIEEHPNHQSTTKKQQTYQHSPRGELGDNPKRPFLRVQKQPSLGFQLSELWVLASVNNNGNEEVLAGGGKQMFEKNLQAEERV